MIIPEHTKVPDTNGSHQRTDHLVELASGGPKDSAKSRVPHVKEGFDSHIIWGVLFRLLSCFAVGPVFGH